MKDNEKLLENLKAEEKLIIDLLQKNDALTKNDISHAVNIKLSRLNYIMEPLIKSGIIVNQSIGESSGGRKPVLYTINSSDYYVIGIDISIMYTQIVIVNLKMEEHYQEIFYMDKTCTPQKTINKIGEIIKAAYQHLNINQTEILGVGVGSVGPLDVSAGIIKNPSNFYADNWQNVPIKAMLEATLNLTVAVENGANAGVAAEALFGAGKKFKNVAYFNCGVGIRTGTISSGNLIRTINDEEEGFGHMVIDIRGEQCKCGNFGCLECYSSINAIIKKYSDEIKKGRQSQIGKSIDEVTYIDICLAAEKNDPLAIEILEDAALILGAGLANYIKLLTPDLVILSGPLNNKSELFYNVCVKNTISRLHVDKRKQVSFNRSGQFKEKAMAMGAAIMFIERYLN